MLPHIRAMIAAAAFAFITGKKVAGVYDHLAARHLRIAAEARGGYLQGFDGDRGTKFAGALPELYDQSDRTFISIEIDGQTAKGHDRGSSTAWSATVTDRQVQVYDHSQAIWFAFDVQTA